MKYTEEASGFSHSVAYTYDTLNNMTGLKEVIDGRSSVTSYTYDKDNRITSSTDGTTSVHYTYDAYGRVSKKETKNNGTVVKTEVFTYENLRSDYTSAQIATHAITTNGSTVTYSYTYDKNGNITGISDGTGSVTYAYDSANQLIREDDPIAGTTKRWIYDANGNMLSHHTYAYTTGNSFYTPQDTVSYGYNDSQWGDWLSTYDGENFYNDALGNLVDERGRWSYTWKHGRQLDTLSNGTTTWSFTYDANGMRTKRTNGSTTYRYVYNGGKLSRMTRGSDTLYFTYDPDGKPLTLTYNGTRYYYVTNLQGDVVAITDSAGAEKVRYRYDAWGNPYTTTGTMASTLGNLNPLRYRGYVYDWEYRLYYLQSRYYSHDFCRFISADSQISGVGGDLLGYNQFSYCFNNPVNATDASGNWPNWGTFASGAGLLAVGLMACAAAATVVSGGACAPLLVAACVTFAAGGMTVLNGAAEMIESATEYNYMRDGVYGGDSNFYETQKNVFATTAEVGTAALGAVSGSPNVCFVAGTMVLVREGTKAIQSIVEGDYVWAWDEKTGDVALKPVVETYINETTELIHLSVSGEEIVTTPSHPFYSPIKGWTSALHLRAGDTLLLVNGKYVVVERVQHEILESPITVYNFQVADYHTYFVSGTGVLVHNSCNHNSSWDKERKSYWKRTSQTVVEGQNYGAYTATTDNINRMHKGLAPVGWDSFSVELHHWQGIANNFYDYSPVTRTLHQLIHLFE